MIFAFKTETTTKLQVYAEKYAADQDAFFKDYAESHAKLSNLGAKFNPPEVSRCYISVVFIASKPLSSSRIKIVMMQHRVIDIYYLIIILSYCVGYKYLVGI